MKIPVLVIAILSMIGIAFAASNRPSPKVDSDSVNPPTGVGEEVMPEEPLNAAAGTVLADSANYVEYTEGIVQETLTDRQILFFYANWCPTCKAAQEDIEKNLANLPEDITVIRVNYNDTDTSESEKALAKKYGITYQHTFVQIGPEGNEMAKWNGGGVDEIIANIKTMPASPLPIERN